MILSKQPIQRNSVGPGLVSHRKTSTLHDHLDHRFFVVDFSSAWWTAINREWVTCGTLSEDTRQGQMLFLEPLTKVISHRHEHGSVAGARAREQLKTEV